VVVEAEQRDGGSPLRSKTHNRTFIELEVCVPGIKAWVIEAGQRARFRIQGGQVRSFIAVTGYARERQVGGRVGATVLARDDVVELVRVEGFWFR
jgi:hypothetical protein